MNKDIIEHRNLNFKFETREEGSESKRIFATIAKFNEVTDINGWYLEEIESGFFDDVLAEKDLDVMALFNHDKNYVIGRTLSGTLRFEKTDSTLNAFIDLPDTSAGNDLYELVKRGDISGCSFTFIVEEDKWYFPDPPELEKRTLIKCKRLIDVGPVTFPAYKTTDVEIQRQRPEKNDSIQWKIKQRERELQLMNL